MAETAAGVAASEAAAGLVGDILFLFCNVQVTKEGGVLGPCGCFLGTNDRGTYVIQAGLRPIRGGAEIICEKNASHRPKMPYVDRDGKIRKSTKLLEKTPAFN